jgi:hypothetical protein
MQTELSRKNILEIADKNRQKAFTIIDELKIIACWQAFGAVANLVGSLRTGLLMKNLDIDFHIYSDSFSVKNSFGAVALIAENPRIKNISYTNLLDTDEQCIEWHLRYIDDDTDEWKIDLIHILKGSRYDGYFENVADRIKTVMTPEQKFAILSIKNDTPDNVKIKSIEIYQAVIRDGIRSYREFCKWKKNNNTDGIIEWIP